MISRQPTIADVIAAGKFTRRSAEDYQRIGADLAEWLATETASNTGVPTDDRPGQARLIQVFTSEHLDGPREVRSEVTSDLPDQGKEVSRVTARDIKAAWLVCEPDPAVDALARLALEAVEASAAKDAVIRAAVALAEQFSRDKDKQRRAKAGDQ